MSNAATELEVEISNGKITNFEVPDGKYKLIVLELKEEQKPLPMVLIEASKLRLDDEILKHRPKTEEEKEFKELISEAIKSGLLKDFYRPVLDPSFNYDESAIRYISGKKPANRKTYMWWENAAKEFMQNCRIGTRYEYAAFIAVLIKKLVESGWSISKSWKAVCNDSRKLAHCWDSDNAKNDYEDTGSREVCGFYDLGNTYKILADDKGADIVWVAGCCWSLTTSQAPLANVKEAEFPRSYRKVFIGGTGWLVINQ